LGVSPIRFDPTQRVIADVNTLASENPESNLTTRIGADQAPVAGSTSGKST